MGSAPPEDPYISVVVPVYRNRKTLRDLYRRLCRVLDSQMRPYELLFVDDACPEASLEVLEALAGSDPRVGVLALARNVGQQRAVLAGLRYARGRCAVVMDADLQDPPEAIPALLAGLQQGAAAVFGGRRGRYESVPRLLTSRLFKGLLHLLCGVPTDAGLFVAMNRRVIEGVLDLGGAHPHLVAMIGCIGLPLASTPVRRAPRPSGRSAYTSWARFKTAYRALAWVIAHRCGLGRQRAGGDPPVKALLGARFAPPRAPASSWGARP